MMIKQFFYFDALECLPAEADTVITETVCQEVKTCIFF